MKALSGYAEWFWLMAKGWKDVENRSRALPKEMFCKLPVRIYLHASKTKTPREGLDFINSHLTQEQYLEFSQVNWDKYRGTIIGETTIVKQMKKGRYIESDHVDVGSQQRELQILVENKDPYISPWFFGTFGYVVTNSVLYKKPVPCRGMLGFFTPEIDIKYLMPSRFICRETGKEYELINCIGCEDVCELMKKQLSEPTTRRMGVVSGK